MGKLKRSVNFLVRDTNLEYVTLMLKECGIFNLKIICKDCKVTEGNIVWNHNISTDIPGI